MKFLTTLDQLRSEATPGEWEITPLCTGVNAIQKGLAQKIRIADCRSNQANNAAYIVALHNSLPAIQEYITLLEQEAASLTELYEAGYWSRDSHTDSEDVELWEKAKQRRAALNEWKEKQPND